MASAALGPMHSGRRMIVESEMIGAATAVVSLPANCLSRKFLPEFRSALFGPVSRTSMNGVWRCSAGHAPRPDLHTPRERT